MRIAVVGGEGTGKTVLGAAVAKSLGHRLLPSLKDLLLEGSGYHTIFEWMAAHRDGWTAMLEQQLERERKEKEAIFDSAAPEILCVLQRWGWNQMAPDRFEDLWRSAIEAIRGYDKVLLLPPRIVAGFAASRFRSPSNNGQIHRLLGSLFREAGAGDRLLALDDAEESARCSQALAFLKA